jgi:hypothetical protein
LSLFFYSRNHNVLKKNPENNPQPPQSYPWFSQRKPSYGNRETPIASRITDGRNHQETNVSLDKRGYYSSDLKNEKSSQGSAPAAERQNKWREVPEFPRNYFPQMFNKNPSYFGQGQRRLAL